MDGTVSGWVIAGPILVVFLIYLGGKLVERSSWGPALGGLLLFSVVIQLLWGIASHAWR